MKKLLSGMPEKPNCSQLALPAISVSLFDNDEDVAKYVQLHTATACIQEEKWWSKVMDANQMQMTSIMKTFIWPRKWAKDSVDFCNSRPIMSARVAEEEFSAD